MTGRVRIVVLDGFTANPGDLSWQPLRALGECDLHDRTSAAELAERIQTAEIVLTNKVCLDAETIQSADPLKLIAVLATGFDGVDVEAARQRQIPVVNVPSYSTAAVAQLVFAHLLHWTCHVADHAAGVTEGQWASSPDWCYWEQPLVELAGKTIGIVGLGQIGKRVADIAGSFGMRVLATIRPHAVSLENIPQTKVKLVELDELLCQSDVVSLHCPLTEQTNRLINAHRLSLMKPTAYLINTARGGLVDSQALASALEAGRIAGAGLDVLDVEPPPSDHPLVSAANCVVTPHIAWATREARQRLLSVTADNVRMFLAGTPQNVVNPW